MTSQDQIPLAASTIYCDGVQIEDKSNNGFINLYVFPHTPPLTLWQTLTVSKNFTIAPKGKSIYWSYYMNQGSQVNLSLCAEPSISLYVFKGKDNFDGYEDDEHYDTFYHNQYSGVCLNGTNGLKSIRVSSRDEYYFLFKSDKSVRSNVNMTLSFNRTMYNISATSGKTCHANPTCSLPLNYASSQFTLLVTNDTLQSNESISVHWSYSPRNWFYGVAFVLPAGLLFVIIVAYLVHCYHRIRGGRKHRQSISFGSRLLQNFSPTGEVASEPSYPVQWAMNN
ncbi:uncharacterized protein LOC134184074 [Corticium candelabrum]|uniref:uncharacterized protein LOC134184074 n=1 Tax=Corticium candelabrum TaxID=121492 RepID=UPI002E2F478E|nr:uncharacterized protein LOC134184074 [Corticium candelabrum]